MTNDDLVLTNHVDDFRMWTIDHYKMFDALPGSFIFDDSSGAEIELSSNEVWRLHCALGHDKWLNGSVVMWGADNDH